MTADFFHASEWPTYNTQTDTAAAAELGMQTGLHSSGQRSLASVTLGPLLYIWTALQRPACTPVAIIEDSLV